MRHLVREFGTRGYGSRTTSGRFVGLANRLDIQTGKVPTRWAKRGISSEPSLQIKEGDLRLANIGDPVSYFRVEKMRFAGKRGAIDKTTVVYSPRITLTGIPLEAYDYVVNGKSALEWVMERQCVKTDPASSIVNDANLYANETRRRPNVSAPAVSAHDHREPRDDEDGPVVTAAR